jgi:CD109 antigen
MIVAPRVVRPAEKIRISCTIMNKRWNNLIVKALIFTDEQEIVSGFQEFIPNVPNTIAMIMPNNVRQGNYRLRVEGKLPTGEMTFSNERPIIFEQKAVSILIQLDRPDFKHESVLRFRCIPIYPDLSAYFGTLDAYLISPSGIVSKRWENVQTNAGVVSFAYMINDAPPAGLYTIKCIVMGYEAAKQFEVYEFYQWKYEVNVSMPHYHLTTSAGVSGLVVAK